MDKRIEGLFADGLGLKIYSKAQETVVSYDMESKLKHGVLVGLSGGADSVMLLLFLCEYRRKNGNFNIVACHLNHMIRKDSAMRDEAFSKDLCSLLDVPFVSIKKDVTSIAKQNGLGVEEAARNIRYKFFADLLSGRDDVACIATAHNLSDNVETVIFNIARGSSLGGLGGIPAVRDKIIRPLIDVASSDIRQALDFAGIDYVVDETNLSDDYTRNFIRHNISPKLDRINTSYENAIGRMSRIARQADDYISCEARRFISERGNSFAVSDLREMHPALLGYVLSIAAMDFVCVSLEEIHISNIVNQLCKDNFQISLPSDFRFVCERGVCRFAKAKNNVSNDCVFMLTKGKNNIDGFALSVYVGDTEDKISSNVYKFSIHQDISFDKISGGLYLRFKKDGDAYRYAGHTHKLKKVFNDRNIPPSERDFIPVICDDLGILWVPGLSVRESSVVDSSNKIRITLVYEELENDKKAVYTAFMRK